MSPNGDDPQERMYLIGGGQDEEGNDKPVVAMPESEMMSRIEAWYDSLSEKDQAKFRERLWAPIRELGEQQREHPDAGTGAPTEPGSATQPAAVEGPGPDEADRPQPAPEASAVAELYEEHNGEMYR